MIPVLGVGLSLQPDREFLGLLDELLCSDVDYYEVTPETLWWKDEAGHLQANSYHRSLQTLIHKTNRPVVGHGVGLSLCGRSRRDSHRRKRWLDRIAEDHKLLRFEWYTDHLGISAPDGRAATLPLPLLQTKSSALLLRRRLRSLQKIVPAVGVENSVFYFTMEDPLTEPAFLQRALSGQGMHLLLDLHNVYTSAKNFGFDPNDYVAKLNLDKVIELHLSGGTMSDPSWLPTNRSLRLDSHDSAVPEAVWHLFESVLPRCHNLRGVTVERMEGTVHTDDVRVLKEELFRAKRTLRQHGFLRD